MNASKLKILFWLALSVFVLLNIVLYQLAFGAEKTETITFQWDWDSQRNIVIDNGSSNCESTGTWQVSSGVNPFGNNSLYSKEAGATYTFKAAINGPANVGLWWTEYNTRSTNVQVEIRDGDTLLDTVSVDQSINGGQWNNLGQYNFTGNASVTILSDGINERSYCADAVRFSTNDTTGLRWKMYMRGEGQAYDYSNPLFDIENTGTTKEIGVTVNGAAGSTVTRYFVLRACIGDNESGDSNEVSYVFSIPEGVNAPYNLKINFTLVGDGTAGGGGGD